MKYTVQDRNRSRDHCSTDINRNYRCSNTAIVPHGIIVKYNLRW